MQTHLHFSGGYGHQHDDVLAMTLFARGQERLGDIGYTHTRYRSWTLTTLSHNTVTVDGTDQHGGSLAAPSDGSLMLFVPGDDDVLAVVEADGGRAYPDLDLYRRMLIQVGAGEDAYVVDLFRVEGGSRHEYVLTGDADHAGELAHAQPTSTVGPMLLPEGTEVKLPTGENTGGEAGGHNLGYAFLRDVEELAADEEWTVTFNSEAPTPGAIRVHGAKLGDADVLYSTQAPSVRPAGEDDGALDRHTMPVLVHRREAADAETLSSAFVSVLEATGETGAFIDRVERLPVEVTGGDGWGLRITWDDVVVDLILIGSEAQTTVRAEGVELTGRLGFVRTRKGETAEMRLVGGTQLKAADRQLSAAGVIRGDVSGTMRREVGDRVDALIVDLADASQAVGLAHLADRAHPSPDLWAIVIDGAGFHHGHRIVSVEDPVTGERVSGQEAGGSSADGQVMLVLADDPGYTIDAAGGRQAYFPGREWEGVSRVEIATHAQWSANIGSAKLGD